MKIFLNILLLMSSAVLCAMDFDDQFLRVLAVIDTGYEELQSRLYNYENMLNACAENEALLDETKKYISSEKHRISQIHELLEKNEWRAIQKKIIGLLDKKNNY